MSRRRIVLVLVAGVAVAAMAGVLVARHEHAQAYGEQLQRFEMLTKLIPPYPAAFFYPMGEDLHVDGVSREMAYAMTEDPPRKVADRYEAVFGSQGFEVERFEVGGETWVVASDDKDPWLRTVMTMPSQGMTMILASVRPLDRLPQLPRVPVPESCRVISHTGARDGGVRTEMAFLVCEGYLSELLDFYDDALYGSRRRVRIQEGGADGSAQVTYSAEGVEVILAALQADIDPARVTASVTWQERR
ncbi:hypothetical protein ACFL6C_09475 [Myxococcota bacterium]